METQEKTLEQLLEQGEERFPNIVGLYQWSLNYDAGKTPFTLFIDLIGYTQEQYGQTLYDLNKPLLGYLELDYLGDALKEYATIGQDAYDFVVRILDAEMSA
ncbi:MAG: hypothetical protein EB054_05615 [Actinobacteria bacterium]|nr:hypothetical protein [Actinomycetota bacterium]